MKHSVRTLAVGALTLAAAGLAQTASAQQNQANVVRMTGDKDAVWIATADNQLIYCWWPQDPKRLDQQASCRVLNRFRIDRLQ